MPGHGWLHPAGAGCARPGCTVPAIAVSGIGLTGNRKRALDAGFEEMISKPVDLDALLAAIVQGARRLSDALAAQMRLASSSRTPSQITCTPRHSRMKAVRRRKTTRPGFAERSQQLQRVAEGEVHQHADRRTSASTPPPKRASDSGTRASCSVTPTVIAAAIEAGPQLIGKVSG